MSSSYTSNQLSAMTNEQLVLLAQDGNEAALGLLVSRMMPVAYSCAAGYKTTVISHEDLVQEGMLGLLVATRTYSAEKKASFRTYAGVCIKNKMASAVRALSRGGAEGESSYVTLETVDFDANPEEMVIAGETRRSISDFIVNELSEFEQSVIRLYLAGNSYKEISDTLSTHPKAVDNALQRIRRKLIRLV